VSGAVKMFLAQGLMVPTGLATVAFLTRALGPDGYGVYGLAVTLVMTIEWTIAHALSRATIRLVGSSTDWKPVATRVLQIYLVVSLAVAIGIWFSAPALAGFLDEPRLIAPLRLLTIDVPLLVMGFGHQVILTGRGQFGQRALAISARWVARVALIVLFVSLGLSINGAILGTIGASLVELIVAMRYDRPALFRRVQAPVRALYVYALPLFLLSLGLRFIAQVDLIAFKALGGTTAMAGVFAGARSLALMAALFSMAFSPLLLSTLSRLVGVGDLEHARDMGRDALRFPFLLLPLIGIAVGASIEITVFALGVEFEAAAPLLEQLVIAGVAMTLFGICSSILTAAGKPHWTFALIGPLAPIAVAGHLVAVPRWGAIGAASVTASVSVVAAVLGVFAVGKLWHVWPPPSSILRGIAVALATYVAARWWVTTGWLIVIKLTVISIAIPVVLWVSGEFDARERRLLRAVLLRPWEDGPGSTFEAQ
jgi:O-antigen/teichoic acid export membrane protein